MHFHFWFNLQSFPQSQPSQTTNAAIQDNQTWLLLLYLLSLTFSALTLFVEQQEGHQACKN